MILKKINITNFKGINGTVSVNFDLFNSIVGQNDAGKSTILKAIDAVLNNTTLQRTDFNVSSESNELVIELCFDCLNKEYTLGEEIPTTIENEELINEDNQLVWRKVWTVSDTNISRPKTSIIRKVYADDNGGKQGSNFKLTSNDSIIIVTNNNFVLDNIALLPNQHYSLDANFHFLTKELTNKNLFTYRVAQYDKSDHSLIDITHITIQKETRTPFLANAGNNLEIDKNETIIISAEQISEAAVYNWYDTEGNLVYTGKNLTVSADVTKKYKLEIIAEADGFKDYDEVDIKVNQFYLNSIVPNPASNNVIINYKTIDVTSAYLMIIGTNTNTSNNYIINTNQEQVSLNISNYPVGYYTIALVCNGNIVDAKTLIKN